VRSIGTNSELISTALSVPDNGRVSRDWLTFDAQERSGFSEHRSDPERARGCR
jgi:hypothetical protein